MSDTVLRYLERFKSYDQKKAENIEILVGQNGTESHKIEFSIF